MNIEGLEIFTYILVISTPIIFALGAFLMNRHYKKTLEDCQCQTCKHFKECKGFWRVPNKEDGTCKIHQEVKEDEEE